MLTLNENELLRWHTRRFRRRFYVLRLATNKLDTAIFTFNIF
jgi:hypothetical protein